MVVSVGKAKCGAEVLGVGQGLQALRLGVGESVEGVVDVWQRCFAVCSGCWRVAGHGEEVQGLLELLCASGWMPRRGGLVLGDAGFYKP
ncbi:hypothetical protein PIB30_095685 [Stylosanthes scabra]|uniref:Uncharacterized protein n=1 Tax=Stylosanthes scabra TaxID=79078 RepID=A0ABU6ZUF0_9FABA|nr:hypothetical protein [Stylosanthes scabra]